MVISESNKKRLASETALVGWKDSINKLIRDSEQPETNRLLIETRFTHTGWIGLFDLSKYSSAIVIDIGLGGSIISLAQRLTKVYAICHDTNSEIIFRERVKYFGLDNVTFVRAENIGQMAAEYSGCLLASIDDGSYKQHQELVKSLLCRVTVQAQIHLYQDRFISPSYLRSMKYKYFLVGGIRAPFQFTPRLKKLERLGFIKYKIFSFISKRKKKYIISTDAGFQQSLFGSIIEQVKQRLKLEDTPVLVCGYFVKPFGILLKIVTDNQTLMLRIAFDEFAKTRYDSAVEVLKKLEGLTELIPKILLSSNYRGNPYQLETFFRGDNIEPKSLQTIKSQMVVDRQALDILVKIQRVDMDRCVVDQAVFEKYFNTAIDSVSNYFSVEHRPLFMQIKNLIEKEIMGANLPILINHGDFSVDNLMMDGTIVKGLIDWEFSHLKGLPLVDLLFYIISVRKMKNNIDLVQAISDTLLNSKFLPEEQQLVDEYCAEFNISSKIFKSLSVMVVINFLHYRLDIKQEIERKNIYDRNYLALIKKIASYLQGAQ